MTSSLPKSDVETSIWIARPPEFIWNYLVDVSNETQWRAGVNAAQWISDPPYGINSTGLHAVEGREDWPWKITEWEELHIASWDYTGGIFEGGGAGYRVKPEDAGSRVTIHFRMRPSVLTKILLLLMKRRIRRQLAGDLEKLKAIMEA